MGHGTHGAEGAPGAGLIQGHGDEAQQQRGEHQAVKAEGELGHPVGERSGGVGPAPGDPEGPEELNGLPQGLSARGHQIGLEQHGAEHSQEEDEETVPEPGGGQPTGGGAVGFSLQTLAQHGEELSPAAQVVAEVLISAESGKGQGKEKVDHAQPGEQDVEKAQGKVQDGPEP